jgi:hypothetical protein
MERHIHINAEYNLVVCIGCKRALTPDDGVVHHLRNKHKRKGTDLQEIKDYLDLGQANDPKTVRLPLNGGARQPVIPVEEEFKCKACPFITASRKRANIHWTSVPHTMAGPQYSKVDIQTCGRYARYWIIGSKGYGVANDGQGEGDDEGDRSGLDVILQNANKRLRETNKQ